MYPYDDDYYKAELYYSRPPTGEERRAAVQLAKELEMVTYPSRQKIKVATQIPPGTVVMGQAMLYTQQRLTNAELTAKPFRTLHRERTIKTPLIVGGICDISGSMSGAQEPLGVSRWILSEAIHRVGGTMAVALMGNTGYPIQAPHERVKSVEVYHANGPHEDFPHAFRLIDGALDIIDSPGARLLVIITDGNFVMTGAVEYAEKMMDLCRKSGVAVIWLTMGQNFAREDGYGWGSVISAYGKSPVQVAKMLGKEVISEFRRVAPQHM
jgi:hypothetical protein